MHTCWMMGSSEVVVLYLMRSTSCKGFSDFVVIRSYDLSYGKTRPYESLYQKGKTLTMSFRIWTYNSSGSSTSRRNFARRWNSISSNIDHWGEITTEDSLARLFYKKKKKMVETGYKGWYQLTFSQSLQPLLWPPPRWLPRKAGPPRPPLAEPLALL